MEVITDTHAHDLFVRVNERAARFIRERPGVALLGALVLGIAVARAVRRART